MKILMINSVCGIKSTGRICTDLAEVLESHGNVCKIAYGRDFVPEKYEKYAVRIGGDLDVKMHALRTRLFDTTGLGSLRATKKFINWVKEYNPDVIHLHNLHGYYINIKLLFEYLKESGKKVIWTLHDCWAFTGHCSHFVTANCEKWKTGCHNCPKTRDYPASITDRSDKNYQMKKALFSGLSDLTIVTPSRWLADLVKESFLSEYKVEVINNGIDVGVFKPTKSDFRERFSLVDKKIVLGVASVWEKNKGLEDFVKLSELLSEEYKIVLVGLTDRQKMALPEKILGITRTNNVRELVEIYSAADVFVNPTYADTYPTVNLEAQACGTPVISYNTCGSVESVHESCVVEQGNVIRLAELIKSGDFTFKDGFLINKADMLNRYIDLFGS